MQRRERVIRDLRLGGAHRGEKRGLSSIRQSDNAGIRNQLEPQANGELLAGLTRIGVPRRAIGGRLEMGVAEARRFRRARARPARPHR